MGPDDLARLPTRALLARLKRLNWCEACLAASDVAPDEAASAAGMILFKDDPAWALARDDVRAELSTRDHVNGKP